MGKIGKFRKLNYRLSFEFKRKRYTSISASMIGQKFSETVRGLSENGNNRKAGVRCFTTMNQKKFKMEMKNIAKSGVRQS